MRKKHILFPDWSGQALNFLLLFVLRQKVRQRTATKKTAQQTQYYNVLNTTDYNYDANGNMIEDKNKKITDIDYNYMNLPTAVRPEAEYCE